ncbi:MAG TPA: helix-turn-helix domain-containing protein [Vineibacter sp.]|nr:helix-turn-helix domain-containing protein [Vineibacter sp.]
MIANVNIIDNKREAELNEALELLHFCFRAVIAEPDRILAKQGFGRAHHRILYFLAHRPGMLMTELIDVLDVSRQALHRPLGDLLRKGHLTIEPSPHNRRNNVLTLTAKGMALERTISGLQRDAFQDAFVAAGPAAERHWRTIMAHVAATADAASKRGKGRTGKAAD